MSIGEAEVSLLNRLLVPKCNAIFVTAIVDVLPFSEISLIKLNNDVHRKYLLSFSAYLERNTEFWVKYGILTACCIVTSLDARVPVLLAIFSDDSVIIPNGTRVATVFPISVISNMTYKMPGNYVP